MKRITCLSLLPVILFVWLIPNAWAQEKVLATAPGMIDSFEFIPGFPRSGYEWQAHVVQGGGAGIESTSHGLYYPQPWYETLNRPRWGTTIELMTRPQAELPPRGASVDRFFFAAGNNGILRYDRQAANPDTHPPTILATSGDSPFYPIAAGIPRGTDLMALNGRIYWGEVNGSLIQIWSHTVELGGYSVLHAQHNYSGAPATFIKRMAPFSATESLALTDKGMLLAFRHDDIYTSLTGVSTMTLLGSGVTGFDSREETYQIAGLPFNGRAVYYTVGHTLRADSPAPTLQRRRKSNFANGWMAATTLWTSKLGASGYHDQLTEVAVDAGYLYLRKAAVINPAFGGIQAAFADTTLRGRSPAAAPLALPSTLDVIPAAGNNLRTDRFHLYFARGNIIYSVPSTVEPIPVTQLDFEALGVEITQSIQTLDHRTTLVANKRTFVRGYARQRINVNTGITNFSPDARLRVFFRRITPLGIQPEIELTNPINPLAPINRPILSDKSLTSLRTSPENTYLWELPPAFTAFSGYMRAEMILQPSGTTTETRDPANITLDPALNNKARTVHNSNGGVPFTAMPEPGLLFLPVRASFDRNTGGKSYYGQTLAQENMTPFLNRALALLPVASFRTAVALDLNITGPLGLASLAMDDWGVKELAMADLFNSWFWHKDPPGFPDTHWVGCVHEEALGKKLVTNRVAFNGLGTDGEQSIITLRKAPYESSWPGSSSSGGFNLAHELGHNWDQDHVNCSRPGGDIPVGINSDYPFNPCFIGPGNVNLPSALVAFDSLSLTAMSETSVADLMSYGPRVWTSGYTWDRLLYQIIDDDGFANRSPRRTRGTNGQPPYLAISGIYDLAAGTATLLPTLCQPAEDFSPQALQKSIEEAAELTNPVIVCRQRSKSGELLSETSIVLQTVGTDASSGPGAIFGQLVPAHTKTVRVELVKVADNTILTGISASENTPSASITETKVDRAFERVRVAWKASDADDDSLLFTLLYTCASPAGDCTRIFRSRVQDLSADIPLDALPAGKGHFSLIVSDGFNSMRSDGIEITIDEHAPNLSISGLIAGQTLDLWSPASNGLYVCSSATDVDDGLALSPSSTTWSWTGPESGSAQNCGVTLHRLFPGDYLLTGSITDSGDQNTTVDLPFTVAPPAIPEAPSMQLDGVRDANDYSNGPGFNWPLTGGSTANATLTHHSGGLYVMLEGIPLGANGVGAGFLIDADGSRSAGLQADDLAIEITPEGALTFWTGASGSWQPAPPPVAFVEALTFRGETTWSAEIRIPDEVLGGWDHAASFRCYAMKPWPYDAFPSTSGHSQPSTWMPIHLGPAPAPAPAAPTAVVIGGGSFAPKSTETFHLDASESVNTQGTTDTLSFTWTQIDGPTVALEDPNAAATSFSFDAVSSPVEVVFELIVTDTNGFSSDPAYASFYFYPAPEELTNEITGDGKGFEITFAPDCTFSEIRFDIGQWFQSAGLPQPAGATAAWNLAGGELGGDPEGRYSVTQDGMVTTLRIAFPDYADEGLFECLVSNAEGQPMLTNTVEFLLQPLTPPYLTVTKRCPDPRTDGGMIYDSLRARTVLFGGGAHGVDPRSNTNEVGRYLSNDTWEWDSQLWIKRTPQHSPPPLTDFGIAYDSARGKTVIFGGLKYLPPSYSSAVISNEVWEWDGTDWTQITSTTPSPLARTKASLCYDSVRGEILMLGGRDFAPQPSNQTATANALWAWDGSAWHPRTTLPLPALGGAPEVYPGNAFAFDPGREVAVLFGPFFDSENPVWEWDGTSWKRIVPEGILRLAESRFTGSAFYDPIRRRVGLPSSSHNLYVGGAESLPIVLWWNGKEFLRGDTGTLDEINNFDLIGASEAGPSGPVDFTAFDTLRRCLVWFDSPYFFYTGRATTREMHFSKAPLPIHQPETISFYPGAPMAQIRILSAGLRPLNYQWHKDGVPIVFGDDLRLSGEGTLTLTIANPTLVDVGNYSALITNAVGEVPTNPVGLVFQSARLSAVAQGNNLVLTWTDESDILECTNSLQGTWLPDHTAVSPYVVPFDKPRQFYRLSQP